jgi:hypothetical protein
MSPLALLALAVMLDAPDGVPRQTARPVEGRGAGDFGILLVPPATSCQTTVTSPQQAGARRPFSATRVLGLLFRTWVSDPAQSSRLRLHLYSPDGQLYQVLVPHEARPARAQAARRRAARVVEASVPVAGSQILWGSLYGQWTVVPALEGEAGPCGSATAFVIAP